MGKTTAKKIAKRMVGKSTGADVRLAVEEGWVARPSACRINWADREFRVRTRTEQCSSDRGVYEWVSANRG